MPTSSDHGSARSGSTADLLYGLRDRPPASQCLFAAIQHLLAIFVPIITPALIICSALGLSAETTRYIAAMSLFVSGLATFIQVRTIGPIGSGMLSIQGTSFTFVAVIIGIGKTIEPGADPETVLPVIFGVCAVGSVIEVVISRFVPLLRKVFTPLISGIVVTLIGLTLIKVGLESCAGGAPAMKDGTFGALCHLGLAGLVLLVIVVLNARRTPWLRMASILIGLAVGCLVAGWSGQVDWSNLGESAVAWPVPFRYGFGFSWTAMAPIAMVYLVTAIETTGDLTATSMVSGEPIKGSLFFRRISGGILGDGISSLLAATFNTFPSTTFSQNNGIIQLTGVASRRVGYVIAVLLVLLGLFPLATDVFVLMPPAVLGGATLLMFGTVAAAGIRIIASVPLRRQDLIVVAVSLALGLGVTLEPELLRAFPPWVQNVFGSGIVTGGVAALLTNLLMGKR